MADMMRFCGIPPLAVFNKAWLNVLPAMFVLCLTSCDPDKENEQDNAPKSLQSLGFTVTVENQHADTRSEAAPADDESFTVCQWDTETGEALADGGDLVLTCDVTDISESTAGTTRGVPTGTTMSYSITDAKGSRPVISSITTPVETVFGTKGMGVTIYKKEGASGTPALMTPNSEKAAERTASIASFNNVKYTGTVADGWSTAAALDGYYWYWNYKLRLFGYAPYAASMSSATYNDATGGMSFSYTIPSTDPTGQDDLILGSTDWLDRPEPDADGFMNVELNTHHALSAIRIVVDNNYLKSDNTRKSKDFTINSITLEGLKNGGTCVYNGSAVSWTPGSTTTTYSHTYNKAVTSTAATDKEIDLQPDQTAIYFAIPQGLTSDTKFKVNFTRAGETKEITAQLYGSGGSKGTTAYGNYLPGKMYTYTLSAKDLSVYKFSFQTGEITYKSGDASMERVFGVAVADQTDFTKGIANVIDIKTVEFSWMQMTKHIDKCDVATGGARLWLVAGNSLEYGKIKSPVALTPVSVTIAKEGFRTSRSEDFTYYGKDFDMLSQISPLTSKLYDCLLNNSSPQYKVTVVYNVDNYTYCQVRTYYENGSGTGSGSSNWIISSINGKVLEYSE